MKKAFALVLALVMCLSVGMMAFAEYTEDNAVVVSSTTITSAGDADTNVDILVNSTNISVTVPLRFAVVADVAGGACMVPKNGTYYIQNNSAIDVDITGADVINGSNNRGEWVLVEAADTDAIPASGKNEMDMTLTPAEGTAWNLALGYTTPDWTVEAATASKLGVLDISISANASMLSDTDDMENAFLITYTFAAAE